ncbi:MAG: hypothetical protein CSA65_04320 [Proteobacteria bacterium]|nr:MAG: hypothetical protein CSA65_04320 [Pseudomonadota bacterium]
MDPAFGIAGDGTALADETQDIADHVASVTGALGVTVDDLAAFLPRLPDGKLTLANVSALFRHVSLARSLELTARQLVSAIELTGIDPFDAGHTVQALGLLREVRAIRESGLSIEELDYLLRHVDTQPATQEPPPAETGLLLLELRDALRKVEADHPLPAEVAREDDLSRRLAAKLAETLSAADVTTAMAVVDVSAGTPPPANAGQVIDDHLTDLVDPNDAKKKLVDDTDPSYLGERRTRLLYVLGEADTEQNLHDRLARYLALVLASADVEHALSVIDVAAGDPPPANAGQVIDERLAGVVDGAEAKKRLADSADPAYLGERRARLLYALGLLIERLRRSVKEAAVVEKLGASLGLDPAVVAPLVRVHLKHPDAAGNPVVDLLTDDAVRDFAATEDSGELAAPTATDLPEQFAAYRRLHKASMLLGRFRVTPDELAWVMLQGPALGSLDMQALPIAPPEPGGVPYGPWRRLRDAALLRDGLMPRKLFDTFEAAAAAEADGTPAVVDAAHEGLLSTIEQRSRWSRDDIEFLVGTPARNGIPAAAGALGFAYPADWKDERPLTRMAEVLAVVRRVGLPANTVWNWRRIPLAGDYAPEDETKALAAQRQQANGIKPTASSRPPAPGTATRSGTRSRGACVIGFAVGNARPSRDGWSPTTLASEMPTPCSSTSCSTCR